MLRPDRARSQGGCDAHWAPRPSFHAARVVVLSGGHGIRWARQRRRTPDAEALRCQLGVDARAERPRLRLLRSRRLGHARGGRLRALAQSTRLRHAVLVRAGRLGIGCGPPNPARRDDRGSERPLAVREVRDPGRSRRPRGLEEDRLLPEQFHPTATVRREPAQPPLSLFLQQRLLRRSLPQGHGLGDRRGLGQRPRWRRLLRKRRGVPGASQALHDLLRDRPRVGGPARGRTRG
jgi:hypothetical protein